MREENVTLLKFKVLCGKSYYHSYQNVSCTLLFCKYINIQIYNLPLVSYECETWSLIVMKGKKLRVFEPGGLRNIFRPKWEVLTENLHYFYSSSCTYNLMKYRRHEIFVQRTGATPKKNEILLCRKGPNRQYSGLVLQLHTLQHYGRGIGYSNSESGDLIR